MGLLSKIKDVFLSGRDHSAALLLKKVVQDRFGKYGTVEQLTLDSRAKEIRIAILLNGDPEPINVHLQRYEIARNGDDCSVIVRQATASKAWIREALSDFVINRPFSLPTNAAHLARRLL